jgi:hypothetical protein
VFLPIATLLVPEVLLNREYLPIEMLLTPVVFLLKALVLIAVLYPPVADPLKAVVEPIETLVETFPFPLPMNIPFMVPSEPVVEMLPVTPNEPVINADPVNGKGGVDGAKEALNA